VVSPWIFISGSILIKDFSFCHLDLVERSFIEILPLVPRDLLWQRRSSHGRDAELNSAWHKTHKEVSPWIAAKQMTGGNPLEGPLGDISAPIPHCRAYSNKRFLDYAIATLEMTNSMERVIITISQLLIWQEKRQFFITIVLQNTDR
jgi:hypothetical protein